MSVGLPPRSTWRSLVEHALAEDLGGGDVTSPLVIPEGQSGAAVIQAREPLVTCGLEIARTVFLGVDPGLDFVARCRDGHLAAPGEPLATIGGSLRSVLAAERTALNFLARLSGVATSTRRFVEAVAGTGVAIVDTRKTLPGWRQLDKYAVLVGGGVNHRMGLFDGILLKDNHLAAAGGAALAVKAARAAAPPQLRVQVEVETEAEAVAAVEAGADFLLLDNCPPDRLRRIADRLRDRVLLEASGGVTLANVREIAGTGVHRIAIGALTHSAPAADVALEIADGGARA